MIDLVLNSQSKNFKKCEDRQKRESLYLILVTLPAWGSPYFLSMKWLGVLLILPKWNAGSLQGYPLAFHQASLKKIFLVLIYTPGWRETLLGESAMPENTMHWPNQVWNPALSTWSPVHWPLGHWKTEENWFLDLGSERVKVKNYSDYYTQQTPSFWRQVGGGKS